MDRNVRRVDLCIRLRTLQHGIKGQSLADLYLDAIVFQRGEARLSILVQAQDIGIIELEFSPGGFASRDFVASHERRVQSHRREVARVTPLHSDVAMDEAN